MVRLLFPVMMLLLIDGVLSIKRLSVFSEKMEPAISLTVLFNEEQEALSICANNCDTLQCDAEIKSSLVFLFKEEKVGDACSWVCQGVIFSDDCNRSSQLTIESQTGTIRLFALVNANDLDMIRPILNACTLDQTHVPTLPALEALVGKLKANHSDLVKICDTTFLLGNKDAGRIMPIRVYSLSV